MSNTNKNLNIKDWESIQEHIYLCNNFVNKNEVESSLDYLIVSNCRNFKNIYMNEEDEENVIEEARASIFFLFCDYFKGEYDGETEKTFGFKIEGNIENFKKLFLKENVDEFCSHVLIKCQQIERKSLSNRIVENIKDELGNWKTIARYVNINMVSWESTIEDDSKKDVEEFLYKIGELREESKKIESYKVDNIYTYIYSHLDVLTDKQLLFYDYYLENSMSFENLFKCDDEFMGKQLKCSYRKNIVNRVSREILDNSDCVKYNNGYYSLIKVDNNNFNKILKGKTEKDKFVAIADMLKKNNSSSKMLIDLIIEHDCNCMNYFITYIKEVKINTQIYRFLYSEKFKGLLNDIEKIVGDAGGKLNKEIKKCS